MTKNSNKNDNLFSFLDRKLAKGHTKLLKLKNEFPHRGIFLDKEKYNSWRKSHCNELRNAKDRWVDSIIKYLKNSPKKHLIYRFSVGTEYSDLRDIVKPKETSTGILTVIPGILLWTTDDEIKLIVVQWERYLDNLDKILDRLGDKSEAIPAYEKPEVRKHNVKYDHLTGKLFVNGQEIQVGYGTKQAELCKLILKNKESMRKKWDREEILEIWHEKNIDNLYINAKHLNPKFRRQVYNACEKLQTKIVFATGIKDLLIYDTQSVMINSKYVS